MTQAREKGENVKRGRKNVDERQNVTFLLLNNTYVENLFNLNFIKYCYI